MNSWFNSSISTTSVSDTIKKVACGSFHTIFLTHLGNIYACGKNTSNELGTKDAKENEFTPILVKELKNRKVTDVGAGDFSACITSRKELLIWGLSAVGVPSSDKSKSIVKYDMDNQIE